MRRQPNWSIKFLAALTVLAVVGSLLAKTPETEVALKRSSKTPPCVVTASTLGDEGWQSYRKHLRRMRAHYEAEGYEVVPWSHSETWPLKSYEASPTRSVLLLDEETRAVVLDERGKPVLLKEKYVVNFTGGCEGYCTTWGARAMHDDHPSIQLCHGLTPDAMEYVFGMQVSKRTLYHKKPWRTWSKRAVARNLGDKGWEAYKRRVESISDHYRAKGFHFVPTREVEAVPLDRFEPVTIRTLAKANEKTGSALLDEHGRPQYREQPYRSVAKNVGSVYLDFVTMRAVKDLERPSPEDVILWQGLTLDAMKYAADFEDPHEPSYPLD